MEREPDKFQELVERANFEFPIAQDFIWKSAGFINAEAAIEKEKQNTRSPHGGDTAEGQPVLRIW